MRRTTLISLVCILSLFPCRAKKKLSTKRRRHSLVPGGRRRSGFLAGSLGSVDLGQRLHPSSEGKTYEATMKYDDDDDEDTRIKAAATRALKLILVEELGGVGDEVVEPVARRVHVDQHTNNLHIRFQQFLRGLPVEGTSLNLHMSPQGNIFGLNGEFIPSGNMELRVLVDCHEAMESVRIESGSIGDDVSRWVWLSECVPAAVLGNDGLGHLCWKRTLEVQRPGQPPHREVLFASGVNGRLVARHPRTFGARSLETRDCKSLTDNCAPVSKSSDPISTGDAAVDAAHNNAIRVYDFLKSAYGRDSLDGNGMTIISQAHYDVTYNNAFWDTEENLIAYGDGDGALYTFFSAGLDVVAHELGHGVTWYESRLNYQGEPGAVNEALSDIFGATVDRLVGGKNADDTWLIGEDIALGGDAFRDMSDPARYSGGSDYYPDRFKGEDPTGSVSSVHVNSGIATLAFSLLTTGGKHPRKKTTKVVPEYRVSFNESIKAASALFYSANVACLTPSSGFHVLRECLIMLTNTTADATKVRAAFDAVGVVPPVVVSLSNNVALGNQRGEYWDTYYYKLDNVKAGETVTCRTQADNGDADLFVRIGDLPDPYEFSQLNDCKSGNGGSNEECTTTTLQEPNTVYVAINAFEGYDQLAVTCSRKKATGGGGGGVSDDGTGTGGSGGHTSYSALKNGMPLKGQQASANVIRNYKLTGGVTAGETVTCSLSRGDGDADLFVRFGRKASSVNPKLNACHSKTTGPNEQCTTPAATKSASTYVAVSTLAGFSNLTITCRRKWKCSVKNQSCRTSKDCCSKDLSCTGTTPSSRVCKARGSGGGTCGGGLVTRPLCGGNGSNSMCKGRGQKCVRRGDCCGGGQVQPKLLTCDGRTKSRRVCRNCRRRGAPCARNSQCCQGHACRRGACRPIS